MKNNQDIFVIRNEIKDLTLEILNLCRKRSDLSKTIARIKIKEKMSIDDQITENSLRNLIGEKCRCYELNHSFCMSLLDLLISESKRIQSEIFELKS